MSMLELMLLISILLCGLVTGLVYAFAVVVMPGIKTLNDHDFLNAFKVMDRIIQDNQPKFMLVWVGSVILLLALSVLASIKLEGLESILILLSTGLYILGVQVPTARINIPLNNELQQLKLSELSPTELANARQAFEEKWNLWNSRRTLVSLVVLALLSYVAIQL